MSPSKMLKLLIKDEFFRELYLFGLITPTIFSYFEKYHFVQNKLSNMNIVAAVNECSHNFSCDKRTVYRALKFFKRLSS